MKPCHGDVQLDATFHGAVWVVTGLHAELAEGARRSARVHFLAGAGDGVGGRGSSGAHPPPDMNAHDQGGLQPTSHRLCECNHPATRIRPPDRDASDA